MEMNRVKDIRRHFSDKSSSELRSIYETPGENWSAEAVEAARQLLDERKITGVLEQEDTRIHALQTQLEKENEVAATKERSNVHRQIDAIGTIYAVFGFGGVLFFAFGAQRMGWWLILPISLCLWFMVLGVGVWLRKKWARRRALSSTVLLYPLIPVGPIMAYYALKYLRDEEVYLTAINKDQR